MPLIPAVPAQWRFDADPLSVLYARRAVAHALPRGCRPQLADDLGLLTSELVTNAILHGPQPPDDHQVELTLWPADGHYWIAVSDAGPERPVLRRPSAMSRGGRGLLLVPELADTWGVLPRATRGKSVVAGIRAQPPVE
jgi:anti-sigma regulatory factor (Ser/Thr protein kinase)